MLGRFTSGGGGGGQGCFWPGWWWGRGGGAVCDHRGGGGVWFVGVVGSWAVVGVFGGVFSRSERGVLWWGLGLEKLSVGVGRFLLGWGVRVGRGLFWVFVCCCVVCLLWGSEFVPVVGGNIVCSVGVCRVVWGVI